MPETAIAKIPQALAAYDPSKHNILVPTTLMQDVPSGAKVSLRVVVLNSQKEFGDVYPLPGKKFGLSKVALAKLAQAAGVSIVEMDRVDDRRQAHVYGFRVRVRAIGFDGMPWEAIGTKEVDYSEEGKDAEVIRKQAAKAEIPRSPDNELLEARKFAAEICASKALNRALRQVLALRSSYAPEEISRPFIVPRLILDDTDADVKAARIAAMTGAVGRMFPDAKQIEIGTGDGHSVIATLPEEKPEPPKKDPAVQARLRAAWEAAKAVPITREAFVALCKESTGKASSDLLSVPDCDKVDAAISAKLDAKAAQEEELEF